MKKSDAASSKNSSRLKKMRLVDGDLYLALYLKEPERGFSTIEDPHRPHIAGGRWRQFPIGQIIEPQVDILRGHQHLP